MAKPVIKKPSGVPATSSSSTVAVRSTVNDLKSTLNTTISNYFESLTPKLKLIDFFLTFLVLLGVLQFVYVVLIGNFPFNAFLGGFISCVGQFVLLVSLRLQINDIPSSNEGDDDDDDVKINNDNDNTNNNKKLFNGISPERAFGDFIFASLILHFIVIHFIN